MALDTANGQMLGLEWGTGLRHNAHTSISPRPGAPLEDMPAVLSTITTYSCQSPHLAQPTAWWAKGINPMDRQMGPNDLPSNYLR